MSEQNTISESLYLNTEESDKSNLPFFKRNFSTMKKDSLRGAVIILLVCAFGAGPFSFHHPLHSLGIINTSILTIIVMFSYIVCIDIFIHAHKLAPNARTLNEIIEIVGGKGYKTFYDIMFFIFLYIALISLILSSSKLVFVNFGNAIFDLFSIKDNRKFDTLNPFFSFFFAFVIFLLLLKKSIKSFQKISFYGFLIYLSVLGVVIIQSYFYYENLVHTHKNEFNYFEFNWKALLTNFGIICYSFNCTSNFYEISKGVANPNRRRILKIFRNSFVIICIFLLIIGILSYLTIGKEKADSLDLIIFRDRLGDSDYWMIVARSLLIINFSITAALNAYPLKSYFVNLCTCVKKKDKRKKTILNIFVAFLICLSAGFIASIFTNISDFFAFGGALSCMISCFTIPGIIGLKIGYCKKTFSKGILFLWILIMTILSITCSAFSLIKLLESY